MIDIKIIRSESEKVKEMLKRRGVDFDLDKFLLLDEEKRKLQSQSEEIAAAKNQANQKISQGDKSVLEEMKKIDAQHDDLMEQLKKIEDEWKQQIYLIPNLISDEITTEDVVVKETAKTEFSFTPKHYLDLVGDLIDMKRGAKISGTRFGLLFGDLVRLQYALLDLVFELTPDFIPVSPTTMLRPEMMQGMGYVERGGDEIYYLEKDNLYLTGTPEQILGTMHSGEVMNNLPRRYVAFSSCYRREAGSHGKDTKGILRVHQFEKAELFSYVNPEDSVKELDYLLSVEEKIMNSLKIPYRVLRIRASDLGDPVYMKYDIEAWMPGQNEYRETHSASNCTDFQSRRLGIKNEKKEYVHMINATGLAMGRILISIIENYQQADNTILIPEVLQAKMKKKYIDLL